jgi:hypothetical protein
MISMCSSVPGVSLLDFMSVSGVFALDLAFLYFLTYVVRILKVIRQ